MSHGFNPPCRFHSVFFFCCSSSSRKKNAWDLIHKNYSTNCLNHAPSKMRQSLIQIIPDSAVDHIDVKSVNYFFHILKRFVCLLVAPRGSQKVYHPVKHGRPLIICCWVDSASGGASVGATLRAWQAGPANGVRGFLAQALPLPSPTGTGGGGPGCYETAF
jgi:hypothetical protein